MLKTLIESDAKALLDNTETVVLDIRDKQAYLLGRIPRARHLSNENLQEVLKEMDFEQPIIVCCYHGISSQQAGQFLVEQGFEEVYSLEGGFEQWAARGNPVEK